jgi:hypothetical protein
VVSLPSLRPNDDVLSSRQKLIKLFLDNLYKDWEFEKINIKFYKYILAVNKRTTNLAVLAEHGKFPAYISVVCSLRPNDDVLSSRQKLIKLFLDNLLNWI